MRVKKFFKKPIIFLFIFSLAGLLGFAQHLNFIQSKTDELLTNRNLIKANKIHTVTEMRYAYSSGRPDTAGQKGNFYLFDNSGNLIEKRHHTYGGNEGYYYFFWNMEYDKKDRLAKCLQSQSYDPESGAWEEYVYKKKEGRTDVVKYLFTKLDTTAFRSAELFYDKKGLNIKKVWYQTDTIVQFTQLNSFNKMGQLLQIKTIWGEWIFEEVKVDQEIEIKDGDEEKPYSVRWEDEEDTTTSENEPKYVLKKVIPDTSCGEWKYDEAGNQIEFHDPDLKDGTDHGYKVLFKYNARNELIESRQMKVNGKIYNRQLFIYNEQGNLIERVEFYGEVPVAVFHYTYGYHR